MKIIAYFIAIIILNSILSIDYKVISGVEKVINSPSQLTEYNFYINVTQYQLVNFSIITDKINKYDKSQYLSNIYVDEYSSKGIKKESKIQNENIIFINNEFVCSFTNSIGTNNVTKYIVLRIRPQLRFKYLKVKIDAEGGAFDLFNGFSKKKRKFKKGFSILFIYPSKSISKCLF